MTGVEAGADPQDIVNVNADGTFGSWLADIHYADQCIASDAYMGGDTSVGNE